MTYRLRVGAVRDLEDIARYTQRTWGVRQRDLYLDSIEAKCRRFARFPKRGLRRDDVWPGCRSFRVNRHVVFYELSDEGIEVLRVLHQSMDARRHLRGRRD